MSPHRQDMSDAQASPLNCIAYKHSVSDDNNNVRSRSIRRCNTQRRQIDQTEIRFWFSWSFSGDHSLQKLSDNLILCATNIFLLEKIFFNGDW